MARSAIVCFLAATGLLAGCGRAETAPVAAPDSRAVAASERPAGTIVFASDENRLTTIDVATGRRTSLRVRAIPACGSELFVTGGRIVFSAVQNGRTTVFSLPLSLDRGPTRLGTAHMFVPSAIEGRVWLAGTDCRRRAMVGVREVAIDGRVTFESDRRVPGSSVDTAVSSGLVVSSRRGLFVWDPSTGRIGSRLALEMGFGVHGDLLVGCPQDSHCDDVAIVDTRTGRAVMARAGGRYQLDVGGTFSPDGSLLAIGARAGRRWRVALVEARSGTHTIVRASRTGRTYPELAWARSSGWLFIRAGGRVKAYRPGAGRAETLPFELPATTIAFAVA